MKPRGRFDIVALFPGGGRLRITSNPHQSLDARTLVRLLRKYANAIESGVNAGDQARREKRKQP